MLVGSHLTWVLLLNTPRGSASQTPPVSKSGGVMPPLLLRRPTVGEAGDPTEEERQLKSTQPWFGAACVPGVFEVGKEDPFPAPGRIPATRGSREEG